MLKVINNVSVVSTYGINNPNYNVFNKHNTLMEENTKESYRKV